MGFLRWRMGFYRYWYGKTIANTLQVVEAGILSQKIVL